MLGRKEPCKDKVGGISEIIFLNYQKYQYTFDTDGTVLTMTEADGTTPPTGYVYEVKGGNSLVTSVNSSRANGTTFYAQLLTLVLKGVDQVTNQELQAFNAGRPVAIIKDRNGLYHLAGQDEGLDVNGGNSDLGTEYGDLYGYNVTAEAMERTYPPIVDQAVIGSLTLVEGV